MTEQQVLIVEDEVKLAFILRDYLVQSGYQVHCLHEGTDAVEWVKQNQPDIVLLDVMLPGKDGMDICREVRAFSNVPIIMVTARVDEIDRLLGLEIGADDYICKPFSPKEVVARVKALMRRVMNQFIPVANQLKLDSTRSQAEFEGKVIELTAIEFQLLDKLFNAPGHIFSREQLMENMYSDHRVVSGRTIDSHIKKLRKKLLELDSEQDLIKSVYGLGYKWEG